MDAVKKTFIGKTAYILDLKKRDKAPKHSEIYATA